MRMGVDRLWLCRFVVPQEAYLLSKAPILDHIRHPQPICMWAECVGFAQAPLVLPHLPQPNSVAQFQRFVHCLLG